MSLECPVCFLPYTIAGSDHAIYSLSCGHTMGRSCIGKMKENNFLGQLICPHCRKVIQNDEYHPLYGIPDELFNSNENKLSEEYFTEDDVKKLFNLGAIKNGVFLTKKTSISIGKKVKFFDAHNKFLFLVVTSDKDNFEELKIFDTCFGREIYSQIFEKYTVCKAMAINKYSNNVIELCIGFNNGTLQSISTDLKGREQKNRILGKESKSINSICYINEKKFVYSVGNEIILANTSEILNFYKYFKWINSTKINDERKIEINNIQKFRDDVLLGIINGDIYVFKVYEKPYKLYNVKDKVSYFIVDPVTDMILIKNVEESVNNIKKNEKQLPLMAKRITTIFDYDNNGRKKEIFCICFNESFRFANHVSKDFNYNAFFRTTMVNFKFNDRIKTYSFLLDFKSDKLQVIFLNRGLQFIYEVKFEKLKVCSGIVCLNKPQQLNSKLFKVPIAVISLEKVLIYDFYVQFFDVQDNSPISVDVQPFQKHILPSSNDKKYSSTTCEINPTIDFLRRLDHRSLRGDS